MPEPSNALDFVDINQFAPRTTDPLEVALLFALSLAKPRIMNGEVYIAEIDDELQEALGKFQAVFEISGHDKDAKRRFVGYDVVDDTADDWTRLYRSSKKAAELVQERIAANLLFRRRIPSGLLVFAVELLKGEIERPTAPPRKPRLTHRDTLLASIAKEVTGLGFPLGAAKATYEAATVPPTNGCTIAAAALWSLGVHRIAPLRADAICQDKKLPVDKALRTLFIPRTPVGKGLLEAMMRFHTHLDVSDDELARAKQYFSA